MIQVKVDQLFLSNVGFVVLLKGQQDSRSLPIFIGATEAQAIALWMNKISIPRPMTHDLLKNILDLLECRFMRVEIGDLKEGTFYANLIVSHDSAEMTIDSRPSDAIALALRCDAPIFVHERIMDEAGRVLTEADLQGVSKEMTKSPKTADSTPERPKKSLTPEEIIKQNLDKAVAEERYEDAAKLRDELARLHGPHSGN